MGSVANETRRFRLSNEIPSGLTAGAGIHLATSGHHTLAEVVAFLRVDRATVQRRVAPGILVGRRGARMSHRRIRGMPEVERRLDGAPPSTRACSARAACAASAGEARGGVRLGARKGTRSCDCAAGRGIAPTPRPRGPPHRGVPRGPTGGCRVWPPRRTGAVVTRRIAAGAGTAPSSVASARVPAIVSPRPSPSPGASPPPD